MSMSNIETTWGILAAVLFGAGAGVLIMGVVRNIASEGGVAGLGTMSMNSYYLLSSALFLGAIAAKVVFQQK